MTDTTRPLDPLLARQLKRLGASPELEASREWQRFVDGVNEHYLHMAEDRALLSRSIELSTQELEALRKRGEAQRDQLVAVMVGLGESLAQFAQLLDPKGQEPSAASIGAAKVDLARRLQGMLSEARLTEDSGAEVSSIRDNLLRVADQLISLLTAAAGRAAVRKELEVARAVQQLLIPPQATIALPPLCFAAHFDAAEECGGDWWTVSPLPGGRALVVICDVTGHGIGAALISGAMKATCELAVHLLGATLTPGVLLGLMNQTLWRLARRQRMMTGVAAILDPGARTLTVANAGHPFPVLLRNWITHPILAEGPQLGDGPDAAYDDSTVELRSGDLLVCYTDGVTDAEDASGDRFSERRLRVAIQRVAGQAAPQACAALVDALATFCGARRAEDDVTMVVVTID